MRFGYHTGLGKPDASLLFTVAGNLCLAYILSTHRFIGLSTARRTNSVNLWLRFPSTDTDDAVGRVTLSRLATRLGMSEIETIHCALMQLAKQVLPAYEADEGDLTARQIAAIRKRVPQGRGKEVQSTLF